MGVYIDMEMPTGGRILIVFPSGRVLEVSADETQNIFEESQAFPVPPHGDLIDYDFCMENYELLHDDDGNPVYAVRMRDINNAPTIIPAEPFNDLSKPFKKEGE